MPHLNRPLTVINLFGAPGIGKTKTAAAVFAAMNRHWSVGLVQEYAKDLVLRLPPMPNPELAAFMAKWQLKIFAEQNDRQQALAGVFQFAVTDSPLLLSAYYAPKNYYPGFAPLARQVFDGYNNINFFLTRDLARAPFERAGRAHDESDSNRIGPEMRNMLLQMNVSFTDIHLDDSDAVAQILSKLPSPS